MRVPAKSLCWAIAAALVAAGPVSAAKVLEFNFAEKRDGSAAANGDGINTNPDDFFPTNIKDDTGTVGGGQSLMGLLGEHIRYATPLPNAPGTLPPGWDGHGVQTNGENYARYTDDALAFDGDFSAFVRVNLEGTNVRNNSIEYIMGGAQPNNSGWGIYLKKGTFELDVNLQGELATGGTQFGVYNGAGPVVSPGVWTDIGIVYTGTPADGVDDTLKVFLNGQLIDTFTGDAGFLAKPFGLSFAFGQDTFGNEGFKGWYEQIVLWDEAISDDAMRAQSVPEPTTAALALLAGVGLFVARRRRGGR